jgi:hypothetical protein
MSVRQVVAKMQPPICGTTIDIQHNILHSESVPINLAYAALKRDFVEVVG